MEVILPFSSPLQLFENNIADLHARDVSLRICELLAGRSAIRKISHVREEERMIRMIPEEEWNQVRYTDTATLQLS